MSCNPPERTKAKAWLIWTGLIAAVAVPVGLAVTSPLLAWRGPIYIAAGLAGIAAMALFLFQPLLAAGRLPGISAFDSRRMHRRIGLVLVALVLAHVGGLWLTSPPDVIDALLFRSATPFSAWGVIAMWGLFATALVALSRRRLRWRTWRALHTGLAVLIVGATALHAIQIEGTMEPVSKAALVALIVLGLAATLLTRRR